MSLHERDVFRMHSRGDTFERHAPGIEPEVCERSAADQFDSPPAEIFQDQLPVWLSRWPSARNSSLARSSILGPFPIFNIGVHSVPFDDAARFVAQRFGAEQKPSILAVEPAESRLGLSGFPEAIDACHAATNPFRSSGWTAAVQPQPCTCSKRGRYSRGSAG